MFAQRKGGFFLEVSFLHSQAMNPPGNTWYHAGTMEPSITNRDQSYFNILKCVAGLVRDEAKKNKGMVSLSSEVAGALESLSLSRRTASEVSAVDGVREARPGWDGGGRIDPAPIRNCPDLESLRALVVQCRQCPLAETRTQTVFGDGSSKADLVFVGEAPGFSEDQQGKPFVGRAGQLLTDIIVKGMKMSRADVYICNVLKCRPPENRDPLPSEKTKCELFLVRQLELLKPKVICALGGHAAKTLLKTELSTGGLRGKWHSYRGIPVRVTYHPSYLLRSPGEKAKAWEDIQHVMRFLAGEEKAERTAGSIEENGLFA